MNRASRIGGAGGRLSGTRADEILKWIQGIMEIKVKDLYDEVLMNGSIQCQTVHFIGHAKGLDVGSTFRKVNFLANYEHERLQNFTLLGYLFQSIGLKRGSLWKN